MGDMIDESYAAWAELRTVLPEGWVVYRPEHHTAPGRWVIRTQFVTDPAGARPWREVSGATETIALRALVHLFRARMA
jgi:hypothetical protein